MARKCSRCGLEGHDRRTCTEKRDYGVVVRVDNMTKREVNRFSNKVVDVKNEICPEGRGTIVSGKQNQLGYKTRKQIRKED